MANLKPWYKVVTPREDLREAKPLDAIAGDHLRGMGGEKREPLRG